jgi:SAM-dependent methyltransferase
VSQGFSGYASDLGAETRKHLAASLRGSAVSVVETASAVTEPVDYLFAFEVLEHINDDAGAMNDWLRALRPGGTVVVSIPAHQRKFSIADEVVGHVRRYDRADIDALVATTGLIDATTYCYGFPLSVLSRTVESILLKVRPPSIEGTAVERSIDSGVKRSLAARTVSRLLTARTMAPFLWLQRAFYNTDRGDGFVVVATKKSDN